MTLEELLHQLTLLKDFLDTKEKGSPKIFYEKVEIKGIWIDEELGELRIRLRG